MQIICLYAVTTTVAQICRIPCGALNDRLAGARQPCYHLGQMGAPSSTQLVAGLKRTGTGLDRMLVAPPLASDTGVDPWAI